MKRGISLIAVLMFMLAATTASVVVFRMIGSENFSSGARLKATEAYQASESGIDAVQAWLSNKAMDASGLVTQYEKDKKPIELKVKGFDNNNTREQKFKAYLVGMDFKPNQVVKLKFIVEGYGRDKSKVSQAVIFSTDGLYKVKVEKEEESETPPPSNIQMNDYFGGSMSFQGEKEISSATINGDWGGGKKIGSTGSNPGKITGDFIVTGDAKLSGSNLNVGGHICIGGNFDVNNNYGPIEEDAYIGSSSNFCGNYKKDVYSEGNIMFSQSNDARINGSLTLNGILSFENEHNYRYVKKDLVLLSNGAVSEAKAISDPNRFHVCGSLWSENPKGIINNKTSSNSKHDLFNSDYSEYCSGAANTKNLYFKDLKRNNPPGPTINPPEYKTTDGNYLRSRLDLTDLQLQQPTPQNKPKGAEDAKTYCMDILCPECKDKGPACKCNEGCNGSKYKVADPINNALKAIKDSLRVWAPKSSYQYNSFKCLQDTTIEVYSINNGNTQDDGNGVNLLTALNECYKMMKDDKKVLYGGKNGYLIMKLNQNYEVKNQGELIGNFIFIYEEKQKFVSLFITSATSKVMVFFEKGVTEEVTGAAGATCKDKQFNYFIYSMEDINKVNNFTKECPLKGNIFFPSDNCAGLKNIDNNFKLETNKELLNDLVWKGILCPAGQECPPKSSSSGANGSSSASSSDDDTDKHFSTVASRLSVNIDSKEITKESSPSSSDTIAPSILVMPRIVRLKAASPISSSVLMEKYINFIGLNGATIPNDIKSKPYCCYKGKSTSCTPITSINFTQKDTYACKLNSDSPLISNFFMLIE